jgi:hypothetical protein
VFDTEAFSTNNANTYSFIDFVLLRTIVTFQHFLTTSTNLIKQTVLLQGPMAGETDNSFYMLKVGFELDRIVSFPDRGFFMDKMCFTNSSSTYDTNSNSVRIFAFYGAFITFHRFFLLSKKMFHYPEIIFLECI